MTEIPPEHSTRDKLNLTVLFIATALILYLCFGILYPFLPAISWALAISVIAHPLYSSIRIRISNDSFAAALLVVVTGLGIVGPAFIIVRHIAIELTANAQLLSSILKGEMWASVLRQNRTVATAFRWFDTNLQIRASLNHAAESLTGMLGSVFAGSLWTIVQLFLILFILFFVYRDRELILSTIRSSVPLSRKETDEVFRRVADTIQASIYGTVLVASVQGTLGGLMFWLLGIPGAVLWGVIMVFFAVIPYLGAFVIWGPAAIFLATSGQWTQAIVLTLWGTIVVGTIDNLLYPILVGKKLRFHTLLVFFFILGGIGFFGVSGLVLGPVTLAVTDALVRIWKVRLRTTNLVAPS